MDVKGAKALADRIAAVEIDIRIQGEPGDTVFILWPVSEAGIEFCSERLDPDGPRWGGGHVVEHRYIEDIVDGAVEDGLVFGRFDISPRRSGE